MSVATAVSTASSSFWPFWSTVSSSRCHQNPEAPPRNPAQGVRRAQRVRVYRCVTARLERVWFLSSAMGCAGSTAKEKATIARDRVGGVRLRGEAVKNHRTADMEAHQACVLNTKSSRLRHSSVLQLEEPVEGPRFLHEITFTAFAGTAPNFTSILRCITRAVSQPSMNAEP